MCVPSAQTSRLFREGQFLETGPTLGPHPYLTTTLDRRYEAGKASCGGDVVGSHLRRVRGGCGGESWTGGGGIPQ